MKRTGLSFFVEGEYCTDHQEVDDPDDRDWHYFRNRDLHPEGNDYFTIWSQFSHLSEQKQMDMAERAIIVINWLREEKDWDYFDAALYLYRGENKPAIMIYRWELV